jgi:hypothetical protein
MSTPLLTYEGVSYLPIQGAFQSPLSVNDLEGHGIRFVRIQWVDLVNNVCCRVVPLAYFKKLVKLSRPGLSVARVTLGIVFLSVAEGFRHVFESNLNVHAVTVIINLCVPFSMTGQWLYAFDLSSIRLCSYAPKHATIMGCFEVITAPTASLAPAIEVNICPRTILRRVTE